MRVVCASLLFSLFFWSGANAADRYQILPFSQSGTPSAMHYLAMKVDTQTGNIEQCGANFIMSHPPAHSEGCLKPQINGNLTPGPIVLQNDFIDARVFGQLLGLWKIDQKTGSVTFCAQDQHSMVVNDPGRWSCIAVEPK